MSLKNRLIQKSTTNPKLHRIEKLGEEVLLKPLSASFSIKASRLPKGEDGGVDADVFAAEVIHQGVRDPDGGARLFSRDEALGLVREADSVWADVAGDVLRISGLAQGAIEKAKARFFESPDGGTSLSLPSASDAPSVNSSIESASAPES